MKDLIKRCKEWVKSKNKCELEFYVIISEMKALDDKRGKGKQKQLNQLHGYLGDIENGFTEDSIIKNPIKFSNALNLYDRNPDYKKSYDWYMTPNLHSSGPKYTFANVWFDLSPECQKILVNQFEKDGDSISLYIDFNIALQQCKGTTVLAITKAYLDDN